MEALLPFLQSGQLTVDIVDHNMAPNGLVRYGVAPDHADMRAVETKFATWAKSSPNLRWFGGVHVSSLAHLRHRYSAIILAYGAQTDRPLNIPGARNALGIVPASRLVSFYNALPPFNQPKATSLDAHFDASLLEHFPASAPSSQKPITPCIIGLGNVALDVARIFLKDPALLRPTDISTPALERIAAASTKTVHLVGRRGPAHAAFTAKEFRELLNTPGLQVVVKEEDLRRAEREPASAALLKSSRKHQRMFELLSKASPEASPDVEKHLVLHFYRTPQRVLTDDEDDGRVKALRCSITPGDEQKEGKEEEGEEEDVTCSLLVPSIGYAPVPLPELPMDPSGGRVSHEAGRVTGAPGLYVTGWLKRGPQGVIADNRWDAQETVGCLLEDLKTLPKIARATSADDPLMAYPNRVDFDDWEALDQAEIVNGAAIGKPREKFTSFAEMQEILGSRFDS